MLRSSCEQRQHVVDELPCVAGEKAVIVRGVAVVAALHELCVAAVDGAAVVVEHRADHFAVE
jgi:hypothetical protein